MASDDDIKTLLAGASGMYARKGNLVSLNTSGMPMQVGESVGVVFEFTCPPSGKVDLEAVKKYFNDKFGLDPNNFSSILRNDGTVYSLQGTIRVNNGAGEEALKVLEGKLKAELGQDKVLRHPAHWESPQGSRLERIKSGEDGRADCNVANLATKGRSIG